MFNFKNIHLSQSILKLSNILHMNNKSHLCERLKYVTTTNPVKMFKQIGISRGDAFKMMYPDKDLLIGLIIKNKDLVNYIDFDSWVDIHDYPKLKPKYDMAFESDKYIPIEFKIYFLKYNNWLSGKTELVHSINSNMKVIVLNYALAIQIIRSEIILPSEHPSEFISRYQEYFDKYIERVYRFRMISDNITSKLPDYIANHCYTNIHVIKNIGAMRYIGDRMKHCAKEATKLSQFKNDNVIFVQIVTDDPRVKEYTVQYAIDVDQDVTIVEYAQKCNMLFPLDFNFDATYVFKKHIENMLRINGYNI